MREGLWGLYAKNDKTILSPVYNELYFVTNDLLVASRNDTTGMIRPSGKVVIPFAFESIEKLTASWFPEYDMFEIKVLCSIISIEQNINSF